MKGNVYTTGSLNKSWNFQRFYRRAKIFINKYFVEGKLLKEVEVIFFFLEIYRNNDEAIFQWWRTMEKKLLQNENLYQVLGNECFDKFFIEHQLFRKQHCARITHVSCSVCVVKKLCVVQVTVILRCFPSSQRVQTKLEQKLGNLFFKIWKRIFSLKRLRSKLEKERRNRKDSGSLRRASFFRYQRT